MTLYVTMPSELESEEKKFQSLQVLNNHDLFVGSEATDYGDHLHNLHKWEFKLPKT